MGWARSPVANDPWGKKLALRQQNETIQFLLGGTPQIDPDAWGGAAPALMQASANAAGFAHSYSMGAIPGGGSRGSVSYRIGKPVPREPIVWTDLDPHDAQAHEDVAYKIAAKYGINLKAGGQNVTISFAAYLPPTRFGLVGEYSPTVIRLGRRAFGSEKDIATTIAHELAHSRQYMKRIPSIHQEGRALASERALGAYMDGRR